MTDEQELIKVISQSGLFSPEFYAKQFPKDAEAASSPVRHYVRLGAKQGKSPNILFDPAFYEQQLEKLPPDDGGVNAFYHFLTVGWKDDLDPHPIFSTSFYKKQIPALVQSGENPLAHYIREGGKSGVDPSPHFSTKYYWLAYPEVKASNINPLIHFLKFCVSERRNPNSTFDADFYLYRYPDVAHSGINPLVHYLASGKSEGRFARPEDELGALRALPPLSEEEAAVYRKLKPYLDGCTTHLIPVHWMTKGGGQRLAVLLMEALGDLIGAEKVLLLQTDQPDVELSWIRPTVRHLNFAELAGGLSNHSKTRILTRFIFELAPSMVHVISSKTAWNSYLYDGELLSKKSKLYASVFAFVPDETGKEAGIAVTHLARTIDRLTAVFTDSSKFREELIAKFDLTAQQREKLRVLHNPVTSPVFESLKQESGREKPSSAKTPDSAGAENHSIANGEKFVLWASRLNKQKAPEVLVEIATRLPNLQFKVCGDGFQEEVITLLKSAQNISLQGSFQSFEDLPKERFGTFLYTTKWDGLPLILLDALLAEQAVIAPAVGGVPDVITNETGWLIDHCLDVDAFVASIEEAMDSPNERRKRALAGKELVQKRHSWKAFVESLKAVPKYL